LLLDWKEEEASSLKVFFLPPGQLRRLVTSKARKKAASIIHHK
jgi:hypothetical protein